MERNKERQQNRQIEGKIDRKIDNKKNHVKNLILNRIALNLGRKMDGANFQLLFILAKLIIVRFLKTFLYFMERDR